MLPAGLITRVVALWILFGGVFKLLQGTPADLPDAVSSLPFATGVLFKVVVGIELVVGLVALLRPSRGWLPALLLVGAFLLVLGMQIADGEEDCGCFGAAISIAPTLMLAVDGGLALLLLLSRPWRLEPGTRELPWAVVGIVAALSLAGPLLIDREAKPGDTTPSNFKRWVELDLETMAGKKLSDTVLHGWLTQEQRIETGLIIIWRASCEVCEEHLDSLANTEEGERDIVLLELPKDFPDEQVVVERLPEGAWVQEALLPDHVVWLVTPPAQIEVKDGVVVSAKEGGEVIER